MKANCSRKVFRNQVIHCDAGPNVVRAYPVKPDGAGYSASIVNILTSSDTWFRPSDVCVAPGWLALRGRLARSRRGRSTTWATTSRPPCAGRVYRVAPPGNKTTVPKLELNTAAGCVMALQSPNHATRYLAWTRLHELQGKAEKDLLRLWKGQRPASTRPRAAQLLARIKGSETKYVPTGAQRQRAGPPHHRSAHRPRVKTRCDSLREDAGQRRFPSGSP